jgi:hypothetical protein
MRLAGAAGIGVGGRCMRVEVTTPCALLEPVLVLVRRRRNWTEKKRVRARSQMVRKVPAEDAEERVHPGQYRLLWVFAVPCVRVRMSRESWERTGKVVAGQVIMCSGPDQVSQVSD